MFTVDVKDKQIEAVFSGLEGRLSDPSELMAQLGELLLDSTLARFQEGKAPDGSPWAPKSSATIKAYERRKQTVSFKPLIGPTKTLSSPSNFAVSSGGDWARLSSRAIQSAVMQFGAKKGAFGSYQGKGFGGSSPTVSIPWGDIPARPFMGISAGDQENIEAALMAWITQ